MSDTNGILVVREFGSKLVRAKVLAIEHGHYPNRSDKEGKRTKIMAGTVFVPTEVKVWRYRAFRRQTDR